MYLKNNKFEMIFILVSVISIITFVCINNQNPGEEGAINNFLKNKETFTEITKYILKNGGDDGVYSRRNNDIIFKNNNNIDIKFNEYAIISKFNYLLNDLKYKAIDTTLKYNTIYFIISADLEGQTGIVYSNYGGAFKNTLYERKIIDNWYYYYESYGGAISSRIRR